MSSTCVSQTHTTDLEADDKQLESMDGNSSIPKPSFWNLQICGADTYCCRMEFDTSDCCNSTDILSAKPVIGMPTTGSNQAPIASATVGTATPGSGQTSSAVPGANPGSEDCADSKAIYVGAGVGGGLGTFFAISIGFLVCQCRRNKHLKRELNEYRYRPKPAYHGGHGDRYAARTGMTQYGDKARPVVLKDTTWKSFFGRSGMKIHDGYPEQEEAGGNEILELPTITANSAAQAR